MTRQNTNAAKPDDEQLVPQAPIDIQDQQISEAYLSEIRQVDGNDFQKEYEMSPERVNQWLVDSPIEHCPICFDHRRCDMSGKTICTADPANPDCPMIAE